MLEPPMLVLLSGFLLGTVMGAAARWAQFCTLGAIADAVIVGDRRRLRAWVLAIVVAIVGTQILYMIGAVDIGQSIYLGGSFGWLGALLGGAVFGLGMALVGTCGFGTLIRLGGGDLRSLVNLATLGIFAYLTLSGPLAYVRTMVIERTDLASPALTNPGLPELLGLVSGLSDGIVRPFITILIAAALLYYCFRNRTFRSSNKELTAAVIMGFVVCAAWLATGYLGQDPFDPRPPVAFTFVRPLGDSILYVMLASGMNMTFGIASVVGVLTGAHLVARMKDELHREGFDGDREMARHLAGSALMGVGGVLALGCTIGQGLSAISTLALSAPLTLIAIFAGAVLGLRYLEEGSFVGAFRVLTNRAAS
ncbi:MAG: YeeE/YedE family protein [Geminicoccaceae bacterium]